MRADLARQQDLLDRLRQPHWLTKLGRRFSKTPNIDDEQRPTGTLE
jgi:hypothetical protein